MRVMSIRRMDCDHGIPPGTEHDRRLSMRTSPTIKTPKPLLSVEEAANLLGETRSTLYRSIKEGSFPLPIFRIGRRIRIPRRSVERLLNGLPVTPLEELPRTISHPSMWMRPQPGPEATLASPEDSNVPT